MNLSLSQLVLTKKAKAHVNSVIDRLLRVKNDGLKWENGVEFLTKSSVGRLFTYANHVVRVDINPQYELDGGKHGEGQKDGVEEPVVFGAFN